jgi:uncharacterized protein
LFEEKSRLIPALFLSLLTPLYQHIEAVMNNIRFSFVEIPVSEMKRAVDFYHEVFRIDLEAIEYAGAQMAFFPRKKGNSGCALILDESYKPSKNGVLVYLDAGKEMNDILSRIPKAGGSVTLPRTTISENHFYAKFIDSEGNQLALFSEV